ncbi:MAG: hypothetical protein LBR49_05560 [Tannerella sp.]|jgi:hypothetical protein|nr:hypothetical protein [Tannerella sp.]
MKAFDKVGEEVQQRHRKWRKIRNIFWLVIILGLLIFVAIRYYCPYSDGIKSGQLEYVHREGVIFKTYEGRILQSGVRNDENEVIILPSRFEFSVKNKSLAERLMRAERQNVEVHYTKYFGALPWRGDSRFVVDSIISITLVERDDIVREVLQLPTDET